MDLFFNESESGAFLFCFAYFMQNVIANDKKFLFLAFAAPIFAALKRRIYLAKIVRDNFSGRHQSDAYEIIIIGNLGCCQ